MTKSAEETTETPIREVRRPVSPRTEYAVTFVVGGVVVAATWLYQYRWDSRSYEEYIAVSTAMLLFAPLLSILAAMRSAPETFGMTAGDSRRGWRYGAGMLLLMIPLLWASAHLSNAIDYYPLFRHYSPAYPLSWAYVAYFELLYGMYLFSWEWFFRGFLLFGLARGMGTWALFAQAIPFGLLHMGKPVPEFAGSFVAGIVLGFVALRTGSFLTGFIVHWIVAVLYDLLILALIAARGAPLF